MNNRYNRTSPIKNVGSSKFTPRGKVAEDVKPDRDATSVENSEQEVSLEFSVDSKEAKTQYRNFFGRGDFRFAFYPSYWAQSWGKPPLLGIVNADNEFLAEKLGYDLGILPSPFNCTFQYKIKNLGPSRNSNSNNFAKEMINE